MQSERAHSGFTLIEILVSIAIVLLIMLVSVVTFKSIRDNQALKVATQDVGNALRDSRGHTLGSKGDTVYGVHIDEDAVVLFTGTTYSSTSPDNVTIPFSYGIRATSSLAGNTTEVLFSRLTGLPSATGTIVLSDADTNSSNTITVYGSGLIEYVQ